MSRFPATPLLFFLFGLSALSGAAPQEASVNVGPAEPTTIMVVRPHNSHFDHAAEGLGEHLDLDLSLEHFYLSKADNRRRDAKLREFHGRVKETNPALFVLMNNNSVSFIRSFHQAYPRYRDVPCLVLMAVFADKAVARLPNATGIQYEIPAITNLVNLRSLMATPIRRVGVIHRPHLRKYVATQKALCQKERIELTTVEVDKGWGINRRIRKALKELIEEREIDALWVINDNELLKAGLIKRGWNPGLKGFEKPVVTGLENFVTNPNLIGSFGVVPDHYELGRQASELLSNIRRHKWRAQECPIRYPFSVRKIVNLDKINTAVLIRKQALLEMDEVISNQPESMTPKALGPIHTLLTEPR